jgi:REP element-mobilizing transposase RayT
MPRQSRIDVPGALHHVIIRGSERQAIYKDDADRDNLLDRVDSLFVDSSTPLLCLVTDDNTPIF